MPRAKGVRVVRACEACGDAFEILPCTAKRDGRGRYCSRPCRAVGDTIPPAVGFAARIGPPNEKGCILWTGNTDHYGYGIMGAGGHGNGSVLAHRVAWELVNGPIPDGLCVLHSCDVPLCVNVEHHFLGTRTDNANDKIAKGRQQRGEKTGTAKLTDEKVRVIRARYAQGGITHKELAALHHVTRRAIGRVIQGTAWAHV